MEADAAGTHLKTSLQDLQKLGVTNVSVEGTSATVDLGAQGMNVLDGRSLPAFGDGNLDGLLSSEEDQALTVTLDLGLGAESLLPEQDPIYDYLSAKGIDRIAITESLNADGTEWIDLAELKSIHDGTEASDPEDKGLGFEIITSGSSGDEAAVSLDENLTGIDLLSGFTSPTRYGELIQTLSDTGVMNILVDQGNVKIGDTLAKALVDSGMLNALPNANVSLVYQPVTSETYAYLNTSLKDMAMLGVDKVDYSATAKDKVYVDFGLPTNDEAALNDVKLILSSLEHPTNKVFSQDDSSPATALVVNELFYNNLLRDANVDQDVVDGLLKLGISEIDVLVPFDISGIEATPQSSIIDGSTGTVTVNLIGTDATEYDYLYLKHPVS
jgi:hypothetical protein